MINKSAPASRSSEFVNHSYDYRPNWTPLSPISIMNNDFDFVGWILKTPCLFYYRRVKCRYVKETHMMLVAFWRWWKLLQYLSSKDNERNLCQDLLAIKNTDSDLKVHALHYANELLNVRVRLSKTFANSPNKQKQQETIKNRFWLRLSIVWETHKLTRYQSKEFSYITFLYRTSAKLTHTTNASRYYSFRARNWSLVFDPEKLTFSISSEHKTTYRNPGPCSLPSLWKTCKRISQLSPFDHATWQHPRESPRHVRGSARIYDVRMAQFVLKIENCPIS